MEKKAHRGRILRIMGNEQFTRGLREDFILKRAEAKRIRDDAARSKKDYKVSGSRNIHSGKSWSRLEEMKMWDAAQKSCGKAISQQGTADGKMSKKNAGYKGSHRNGPWELYVKLTRKW